MHEMSLLTRGPLVGLKMVICGTHVAKAAMARIFGALGATVIEIASVATHGDGARTVPPTYKEKDSYFFWGQNFARRCNVAIDLATVEGRSLAYMLLEQADLFLTNLALPVLDRSGLTWSNLQPRFPRLVGGYLSFCGLDGPNAGETGFHHTALARSGISWLSSVDGRPTLGAIPWIDHGAAQRLALLGMAKLWERIRTNSGGMVETSLLEYAVETLGYHAGIAWSKRLNTRAQIGPKPDDAHQTLPLLRNWQVGVGLPREEETAQADNADDYVVTGVVTDAQVSKFLQALELDHLLSDSRFETAEGRLENADALVAEVRERIAMMTAEQFFNLCSDRRFRVPVARHVRLEDVPNDPQLQARGAIWEVEGPDGLPLRVPGIAAKVEGYELNRSRARRYGEDTRSILLAHGLEDWQIDELEQREIIYCFKPE